MSTFTAGIGSHADPYLITSSAELAQLHNDATLLKKHFRLGNDIALSKPWVPIDGGFSGTLNGAGYAISELEFDITSGFGGLFTELFSGCRVTGLRISTTATGIKNSNPTSSSDMYIAVLAGRARGIITLQSVVATGRVESYERVGGLIGSRGEIADDHTMPLFLDQVACFVQVVDTSGAGLRIGALLPTPIAALSLCPGPQ